eukprot:554299-Hanusia_phi.AAC.1
MQTAALAAELKKAARELTGELRSTSLSSPPLPSPPLSTPPPPYSPPLLFSPHPVSSVFLSSATEQQTWPLSSWERKQLVSCS